MNQWFPGARAGDCMQLNTSNLCFNYDDLLSVGSSAPLSQSASTSPAACFVSYLKMQANCGFECIRQIVSKLISSDDDKDVASLVGKVKVDWILKVHEVQEKL